MNSILFKKLYYQLYLLKVVQVVEVKWAVGANYWWKILKMVYRKKEMP